jgi:flagellar protein FliO/FliZ
MTTSARLLTILSLALPLAACAAQPAPAVPAAKPAAGQDAQAGSAALPALATPAAAPAPAAQPSPAQSSAADQAPAQSPAMPAQPRRNAGNAPAPARTAPAAMPAAEPSAVPAPAANAPAVNPASPTLPEATVGGGAANRPAPPAAPVTMPASSATGSLLQTLFALIVVLAVLGALAWFLKRYGPKAMGGNAHLRIVGSLNLGGRERLLVVEVGNQWIVVGASPGRVNALATMPRQDGMDTGAPAGEAHASLAPHAPSANSFADWLKQTLDKRK